MRPYLIQNLQSERGETESARWIAAQNEAPRVTELQGTELVIQPKANEVYRCGTVTALTLSGIPAEGSVVVIFTSGTTAATLTVPQTLNMPAEFTVEANTRYEINVLDGYALCAGWAVSA